MKQITGVVKRHPDGFGFLISDDPEIPDLYVSKRDMKSMMTNDRVRAVMKREPGGDRYRGEELEVVSRSVKQVMGQYFPLSEEHGLLHDKSFAWGEDLFVVVPRDIKVKSGEWVQVGITHYPGSQEGFKGVIKAVIGDAMDPEKDNYRMLLLHNIPHEFSKDSKDQANALAPEVREVDWRGRTDQREMSYITIDGKTAKDFDDAIYIETNHQGFKLYVAIADVSYYVKPGSAIDEDAYIKGTSTYFPNFVSPMLPEKLSNELCSLKPRVPRLAFVAEMQLNFQGELQDSDFYEAVIESKARVTYGEAQEIIEGRPVEGLTHVEEEILRARDLAKVLMARRFRDGSLDLELPETEVQLDETGQPIDIIKSERLFSHRLIEEMMLMANIAVAKFFTKKEMPALYRIHEDPKEEGIENLEKFLATFGSKVVLQGGKLQKKISKALEAFANKPQHSVLSILTLRTMMQAKYSPNNVGHFGLGFQDYTHFTSPIRRYPDLIVHRLLKSALGIPGYSEMQLASLETAGTMLSSCEQRSVKAERQIHAIKKARFLEKHLGEVFDGQITSVTKFGIFVTLRMFDIDGLVRLQDLSADRLEFDEEQLRLVAKKSGLAYSLGDMVRVQVASVNTQEGQIDFVLEGTTPNEKKKAPPEKRRPTENNRHGIRKSRVPKPRRKGKAR